MARRHHFNKIIEPTLLLYHSLRKLYDASKIVPPEYSYDGLAFTVKGSPQEVSGGIHFGNYDGLAYLSEFWYNHELTISLNVTFPTLNLSGVRNIISLNDEQGFQPLNADGLGTYRAGQDNVLLRYKVVNDSTSIESPMINPINPTPATYFITLFINRQANVGHSAGKFDLGMMSTFIGQDMVPQNLTVYDGILTPQQLQQLETNFGVPPGF